MAIVLFDRLVAIHGYFGGPGFVAGIAPGIVTVNGSPGAREVEIRHRNSRMVIATTFSESDGTYRFDGILPGEEYDVIGRDYARVYNDAIVAYVQPEPYAVTSATGTFTTNDAANTLDGAIDIFGGEGHVVTVASGTAPPGITFSVVTDGAPTYAYTARWLIASGTTSAGTYTWTLRVTSDDGSHIDIACSATFT